MAKGKISKTNPPETSGSIKTIVNGTEQEFNYNVKAGHTKNGYTPKVGDNVVFLLPDNGNVARDIEPDKDISPPGCDLKASAVEVDRGTPVLLTYSTGSLADSADIIPYPGSVPIGQGSIEVVVEEQTFFKLIVNNTDGSVLSCAVTVFVK